MHAVKESSLDKWHENMINKYGATTKENPNSALGRANHIAASEERGKLISHKENKFVLSLFK